MINKNTSDHDLLIRLDTKVDILTKNIKELGDGLLQRVIKLESDIVRIDELHAQVDPIGSTKKVLEVEQKIHDFQTTATIYRTLAGILGGAVFFLLTQIPGWIKLFLPKL